MSTSEHIRAARQEAIYKVIANQKNSYVAGKAADIEQHRITDAIGRTSELNFPKFAFARCGWFIYSIVKASPEEDFDQGIDFWLKLKYRPQLENLSGQTLPVNVKSSDMGVLEFKNSPKFQKLQRRIIVINSSTRNSVARFKSGFMHEITRIKRLPPPNTD